MSIYKTTMLDYNALFALILAALTLVLTGLSLIAYLMITGDREKYERARVAAHECTHFFGYLARHPRNQPIPDECFGCVSAIDCIKTHAQKKKR